LIACKNRSFVFFIVAEERKGKRGLDCFTTACSGTAEERARVGLYRKRGKRFEGKKRRKRRGKWAQVLGGGMPQSLGQSVGGTTGGGAEGTRGEARKA
jgi:hypothetical protein